MRGGGGGRRIDDRPPKVGMKCRKDESRRLREPQWKEVDG